MMDVFGGISNIELCEYMLLFNIECTMIVVNK